MKSPQFLKRVGAHELSIRFFASLNPLPSSTDIEVKNKPTMTGVSTNWSTVARRGQLRSSMASPRQLCSAVASCSSKREAKLTSYTGQDDWRNGQRDERGEPMKDARAGLDLILIVSSIAYQRVTCSPGRQLLYATQQCTTPHNRCKRQSCRNQSRQLRSSRSACLPRVLTSV